MEFKFWFSIDESRREIASRYSDLLKNVPQDPIHHPEGNVLKHVQLVRKAIPQAVQELIKLKTIHPFSDILSNIDFSISDSEFQILFLAAWLHDIGKASATTINPDTGKIQAIGHEDPTHYLPQLEKLKDYAPFETKSLYLSNAPLINFLIERHMDFVNKSGFSSNFLKDNFENGKVKNSQKMKLLLVLMWADKMGRKPENTILSAIQQNAERLKASSIRSSEKHSKIISQTPAFAGTAEEFNALLLQRRLPDKQRKAALKSKFPNLTDQELQNF